MSSRLTATSTAMDFWRKRSRATYLLATSGTNPPNPLPDPPHYICSYPELPKGKGKWNLEGKDFLSTGVGVETILFSIPFHKFGNSGWEKVRMLTIWQECSERIVAPLAEGHGETQTRWRPQGERCFMRTALPSTPWASSSKLPS